MRLITKDDIKDVVLKGKQRGWKFLVSKLNIASTSRTQSAFNETYSASANWWDIPYVQKRCNALTTNDESLNYIMYTMQTYFDKMENIHLLSLGSGTCNTEIALAHYPNFENITCIDLSESRIKNARNTAEEEGLKNINFLCNDVYDIALGKESYDVVFFNASLHHFKDVEGLLTNKILPCLKPDGYLIINEYVGPDRLQFPKHQLDKINEALAMIPVEYRKRFKSRWIKKDYSGSGLLRMIIADPSECVDSASIMPAIHKHFDTVIERPFGGNILLGTFKDIAHHFVELTEEKKDVLERLFQFEDDYLKQNPSDHVFGIYQKPK